MVTACVGFVLWSYQPGRFFERELPYLADALARFVSAEIVIVDGYVWLAPGRAGLGAHLHALDPARPVIGVAKTAFAGADAIEVVRGASTRPLYVTAAGMDPRGAAAHVRAMHGEFRIPTLLARVDALTRTG